MQSLSSHPCRWLFFICFLPKWGVFAVQSGWNDAYAEEATQLRCRESKHQGNNINSLTVVRKQLLILMMIWWWSRTHASFILKGYFTCKQNESTKKIWNQSTSSTGAGSPNYITFFSSSLCRVLIHDNPSTLLDGQVRWPACWGGVMWCNGERPGRSEAGSVISWRGKGGGRAGGGRQRGRWQRRARILFTMDGSSWGGEKMEAASVMVVLNLNSFCRSLLWSFQPETGAFRH